MVEVKASSCHNHGTLCSVRTYFTVLPFHRITTWWWMMLFCASASAETQICWPQGVRMVRSR